MREGCGIFENFGSNYFLEDKFDGNKCCYGIEYVSVNEYDNVIE